MSDSKNKTYKAKRTLVNKLRSSGIFQEGTCSVLELQPDNWELTNIESSAAALEKLAYIHDEAIDLIILLNNSVEYKFMKEKTYTLMKSIMLSHHYITSIYDLLTGLNSRSARIILRTMMELSENIDYIYLSRNNSNLNKLKVSEMEYAIDSIKKHEEIEPSREKERWAQRTINILKARQRRLGGLKAPPYYQRAKLIDQKRESSNSRYAYHYWYTNFSGDVHSTPFNMDVFDKGFNPIFVGDFGDYAKIVDLSILFHLNILGTAERKILRSNSRVNLMYKTLEQIESSD